MNRQPTQLSKSQKRKLKKLQVFQLVSILPFTCAVFSFLLACELIFCLFYFCIQEEKEKKALELKSIRILEYAIALLYFYSHVVVINFSC